MKFKISHEGSKQEQGGTKMFRTFLKRATSLALAAMMAVSVMGMSSIDVEAKSKNPTKIYLNKKSVSVKVGKTYDLDVKKAKPNSKKYRTVKWSTSDKKIATVSSKGKVRGIKPGKVTITATSTKNKKVKAKCTVTVYKNGYIRKGAASTGSMYTYKMPDSSKGYRFYANGKGYTIKDSEIKEFMTLFGTSKNSLINRWSKGKSVKISLGQLSVSATAKKSKSNVRILTVKGPAKYEGRYYAKLYKGTKKTSYDYKFVVKGAKTNNKVQNFYVDSSKKYYTYTATNKQGVKYTYKVRKDGKAAYLKAGKKYLYKYEQTSKYDVFSIDKVTARAAKVRAYYYGKITK